MWNFLGSACGTGVVLVLGVACSSSSSAAPGQVSCDVQANCDAQPTAEAGAAADAGVVKPARDAAGSAACDPGAWLGVGHNHACVITADRQVACWGAAFGNGASDDSASPVLVPGLSDVRAISAGLDTSCAILEDGSVACWGDNAAGQLGDGTLESRTTPASVVDVSQARQISLGGKHSCVLLATGELVCWGDNAYGALGPGAGARELTPVLVPGLPELRQVSAGGSNTCALLAEGRVACWGWHWEDNGAAVGGTEPELLSDVEAAVEVSAGQNHDCLVLATGRAACRGYGRQGQLGDGGDATQSKLQAVIGVDDAASIRAGFGGYGHTCALRGSGEVVCWGIHTQGQLGNATTQAGMPPGDPVLDLDRVVAIGAGEQHNCALRENGEVVCWGAGTRGQLGGGSFEGGGPVTVVGLLGPVCR